MIAQGGTSSSGSYQPGGIDTINLQNGSVLLNIPILSYPQKGNKLKLSFSLKFSPTPWFYATASATTDQSTSTKHYVGTWHNQDPQVTNLVGVALVRDQALTLTSEQLTYPCADPSGYCGGLAGPTGNTGVTATYAELFSLLTADRAVHNFGIEAVNGGKGYTIVPTSDGTNFAPIGGPYQGFLGPDGVKYIQAADPSGAHTGGFNQTDPDGNTITVGSSGWTDSLGRQIPGSRSGPGVGVQNAVVIGDPLPGVETSDFSQCTNGASAARTFTVPSSNGQSASYTLCFNNQIASTAFTTPYQPNSYDYLITEYQGSGTFPLLTQFVLPNGTSYSFTYDSYLDLTSVKLPTGGSISYGYQTAHWNDISHQQSRVLQTRTVTDTDGTAHTWTYALNPVVYGAQSGNTLVTDPANNDEDHIFGYGVNGDVGDSIETVNSYSGTGSSRSLLKAVRMVRAPGSSPIILPNQDGHRPYIAGPLAYSTTTWADTNQVSKTVYTQTPGTGSVSYVDYNQNSSGANNYAVNTCDGCIQTLQTQTQREYDYGVGQPGALLRTTTTQYQWQQIPAYKSANLLNLPLSTIIQDGSGNQVSMTQYFYDEANGSPQGVFGHLTSTKSWVAGSTYTTASTVYSSSGVPQQTTDPNGNVTKITAFNCGGAFPKTVVTPYQSATAAETASYVYDCSTGAVTSVNDSNNGTTSYSFDILDRPISVSYPDGGGKSWFYTDTTPSSVKITTQTGESAGPIINSTLLDGFGRTIQTQLQSDPQGTDYVDTVYDSLGRVQAVSNPYRSKNDQTYGITSYLRDALGRVLDQCQPDNTAQAATTCVPGTNYQSWVYTGSSVLFQDENRHQKQQTTDALGRLAQVLEPDGSNNLAIETDYSYDALGNMVSVDQWGSLKSNNTSTCVTPSGAAASGAGCNRHRSFVYDGLSRLTSSTNPESGTVGYTYYNDGSLQAKTDARGIVTNYSYDGLNRLTSKTYTDGTPSVSYYYDTPVQNWSLPGQSPTGVQQTNLVGRLSYETNGSSTIVYSYDGMGRTTLKSVCTPSTCGTDHFDLHASYDLAGNVTFADRGLDAVRNAASPNGGYYYGGLSMSYNSAAQLASADADIVDAAHPQGILGGMTYTPFGTVQTVALGSQYGQVSVFDKRNRMTDRASSNLAGNVVLTDHWGFDPIGNIVEARDSAQGDFTYIYDALNRVTHANIPPFSEDYDYDNWGNQTAHTVTDGSSYQWAFMPTTQNRATNSGVVYDSAGNMLSDGLHAYVYDAESRVSGVTDQSITYKYDPEGMRVATLSGGTVTAEYLYDMDGNLVSTVDNQGQLVRAVLRANQTHWGDYIGAAGPGGIRTEFRLVNQVGTLVANADTQGNFIEGCLSGPFGDGQQCTSPYDYTETHFTDKLRDQETNNDYFGARYFNSIMSRFTSADDGSDQNTANPQSWNLYSYARNNPLVNGDPSGHDCVNIQDEEHGTVVLSVTPGDSCQKQLGGNSFYVKGFIDTGSFTLSSSGDLGYTYTGYDGNAGTGVYAQAPAPDYPGLAGPANQAGAAMIGFGGQAAINFFITNIALSAAGEIALNGIRLGLDAAALSTTADIAGEAAQISRALTPVEQRAVEGVLKQIENGTTKGSPYENANGLLPSRPSGYYRRYTAPLSGQTGRGTSRVVMGANREVYYTPDHYETFSKYR